MSEKDGKSLQYANEEWYLDGREAAEDPSVRLHEQAARLKEPRFIPESNGLGLVARRLASLVGSKIANVFAGFNGIKRDITPSDGVSSSLASSSTSADARKDTKVAEHISRQSEKIRINVRVVPNQHSVN